MAELAVVDVQRATNQEASPCRCLQSLPVAALGVVLKGARAVIRCLYGTADAHRTGVLAGS